MLPGVKADDAKPDLQSLLWTLDQAADKICPYFTGPQNATPTGGLHCFLRSCGAFVKTKRSAWSRSDGTVFETDREPQGSAAYSGGWTDRYFCARLLKDSGLAKEPV